MTQPLDFEGFGSDAVNWFIGLEQDNSKEYFNATRTQWETQVRDPLHALLHELAQEFGGTVRTFRQNRDVRFSPDKSPYKTTTAGWIEPPHSQATLYAQLSAQGLLAATGYAELAADQLERFRDAIGQPLRRPRQTPMLAADQLERFRDAIVAEESGPELIAILQAITDAGLTTMPLSPPLKTAPRGYPREHPRVDLLRQKDLIVGNLLPPSLELTNRAALEHVAHVWRTGAPLAAWLDQHVGASNIPPETRSRRGR